MSEIATTVEPSLRDRRYVNPDSAAGLNVPTCLLPSQNEDEEGMEGFNKVMMSKPFADKCVFKWYKDMPHGWTTSRADVSWRLGSGRLGPDSQLHSEKGLAAFQDAYDVMCNFLNNIF